MGNKKTSKGNPDLIYPASGFKLSKRTIKRQKRKLNLTKHNPTP